MKPAFATFPASHARRRQLVRRLSGLLLFTVLFAGSIALADDPEEDYVAIFNLIQQADSLDSAGKTAAAAAKYKEAQTALQTFHQQYSDWNPKTVSFRLSYVSQKIAACTSSATAPATNAPADSQPDAQAASIGSANVKLLSNGAEPRKVLRLHPKAGDKQSMRMTIKMGMDMQMGDAGSQKMKFPPMLMTMEATVKSVSDNGEISYDVVMSDVGVGEDPDTMPAIAEAIKGTLASMKGMTGSGTMSDRGISKKLDMKVPSTVDPQIKQTMDQMHDSFSRVSVPLPEEAVGVGAKWEVKAPVKSQGMTLDQATSYELLSLEGEQATTKTTLTQNAANQKIQSPAMGGMKVDLTKMTGTGSGDLTLDLQKILPLAAKMDIHTEAAMAMNLGAQKQTMSMKTDMNVQLENQ